MIMNSNLDFIHDQTHHFHSQGGEPPQHCFVATDNDDGTGSTTPTTTSNNHHDPHVHDIMDQQQGQGTAVEEGEEGEDEEVGDISLHAALHYMFDHPNHNTTTSLVVPGERGGGVGGVSHDLSHHPTVTTTTTTHDNSSNNTSRSSNSTSSIAVVATTTGQDDVDPSPRLGADTTTTTTTTTNRTTQTLDATTKNGGEDDELESEQVFHQYSSDHQQDQALKKRKTIMGFGLVPTTGQSTLEEEAFQNDSSAAVVTTATNAISTTTTTTTTTTIAQPLFTTNTTATVNDNSNCGIVDKRTLPSLPFPTLNNNNASVLTHVQQTTHAQQVQPQQSIATMQHPLQPPAAFATTVPLPIPNTTNHNHHHHHHHVPHQFMQHNHNSSSWGTDQITEARRRMNVLIQQQQSAHDELRAAEESLKQAQNRLEVAKNNIDIIATSVSQGTEELIDALLQEPTHWNAMYFKLLEYKEKYGTINVKRNLAEKNRNGLDIIDPDHVKLVSWIGKVRAEARRPAGHPDVIEPYKIIALNRLGFDWDPRENYWMERYEELKKFLAAGGEKPKMPSRKTPLGVWCDGQVLEYNKYRAGVKPCYISKERIDMLESIGFIWDRQQTAWMNHYNTLKQRYLNFGSCFISNYSSDKTLVRWIAKQKSKYKNFIDGKKPALTEEQVTLLNEIHFFDSINSKKYTPGGGSRTKSSKSRGRPKSTTLLPPEAKDFLNRMNHDVNDRNNDLKRSSESIPEPAMELQSLVDSVSDHSMLRNEAFGESISDSKVDSRNSESCVEDSKN